jgi:hypothetical protein
MENNRPRREPLDFKRIAAQAKGAIDKRGGTESLKEDFEELNDIAKGQGSRRRQGQGEHRRRHRDR